ncbi:MAG: lmo0937 family membrane protein [Verrucomicrobia bacterium]|jgi:Family of unknown function (DUF5670)|nr:lmo0937 family membrane protein [Verrucomicrobiota bacterium]
MYAIAATLVVVWLVGILTSLTFGGFIHALPVIALFFIVLRVLENPCDGWE